MIISNRQFDSASHVLPTNDQRVPEVGPIHHQSEKSKNEAKNTKEVSGLDFSLCIFVAFWADECPSTLGRVGLGGPDGDRSPLADDTPRWKRHRDSGSL